MRNRVSKIKLFNSLAVLWALSVTSVAYSQNLVPNPSFETVSACPTDNAQMNLATTWTSPTTGASPDLYSICTGNSCSSGDIPSAKVCVPSNFTGDQMPRTGNNYAGFFSYWDASFADFREYIQAQLSTPLVAGVVYDVTYYVSLADSSGNAVGNIGAYLSNTAISSGSFNYLSCCAPQVSSGVITAKTGWVQVTGSFTAAGGEEYITIGNFLSGAMSPITATPVSFPTPWFPNNISYYYIDDVSVMPQTTLPIELVSFEAFGDGDKVFFEWETKSELNNDYFTIQRSKDAKSWEDVSRISGAGNSTVSTTYTDVDYEPIGGMAYYRLKQTDFDGRYSYSSIRSAITDQTFDNFTVVPNPITPQGNFTLQLPSEEKEIEIQVSDFTGKVCYYKNVDRKQASREFQVSIGNQLPSGLYIVTARTKDHLYTEKVIVE